MPRSIVLSAALAQLVLIVWGGGPLSSGGALPVAAAAPPGLELLSSGPAGLDFRFTAAPADSAAPSALRGRAVDTPGGSFARLELPGAPALGEPGEPALPLLGRLLAVPPGMRARIVAEGPPPRRLRLADLELPDRLLPAQPPVPKRPAAGAPAFAFAPAAYEAERVARPLARVVPLGAVRGVELVRLEISPVAYLPRRGEVELHERLEVRVEFEPDPRAGRAGAAAALAPAERAALAAPLLPALSGVAGLAAALGVADAGALLAADSLRVLVVVSDPAWAPALEDLLALKREEGYAVTLGLVGSPELGSTAESIQAWIAGLYEATLLDGVPGNEPGWLLLVGDVDRVPTFTRPDGLGNPVATDRPFATVDGDSLPDLFCGRLSIETEAQLAAVLAKTLAYARLDLPDLSYLGRSLLIAGVDAIYGPTHANGQVDYGRRLYFDAAHGIDLEWWLQSSASAVIVDAAGRGAGLINYTGHGGPTRWVEPEFARGHVRGLGNRHRYGIVISNSCETAPFDYAGDIQGDDECLAEAWLREPEAGAVAYIGASADTFWDEDFWWAVGASAAIDTGLVYEQTGPGVYDALFHDRGEPRPRWATTLGAIPLAGNLAVMESGSPRWAYYWDVYHVLGDPTLPAHWRVPQAQAPAHPEVVFTTNEAVVVTAAPGARAGLSQGGAALGAATADAAGLATVRLATAPAAGVPLRLRVTGQNLLPYAADLLVTQPVEAALAPDTVSALAAAEVTVTVRRADGSPWAGVRVWAEEVGYRSAATVTTGLDGVAVLPVVCPYGPEVRVCGRAESETADLFRLRLAVLAEPQVGVTLAATSAFGQPDTLTTGPAGRLRVAAGMAEGSLLLARLPDGTELSGAADTLLVPAGEGGGEGGVVRAAVARPGYDLVRRDFPLAAPPVAEVLLLRAGGTAATGALEADLRASGRSLLAGSAADVLPSAWPRFRLLVVGCGAATDPLSDPGLRAALAARVASGRRLLIEGGGIAGARAADDPGFCAAVLGAVAWGGDQGLGLYVLDPAHPLASVPTLVPAVVPVADLGPGTGDALLPAPGWQAPLSWVQALAAGSVLARPLPSGPGGQVVNLGFAYEALAEGAVRSGLLANVLDWLSQGQPLPALAGPLSASLQPGAVRLEWRAAAGACDGFHLYRRLGDDRGGGGGEPARRLTGEPLTAPDGRLVWLDPVAGLPPGATLFYSWAAVAGGLEIARGPETSITLPAAVPPAFALHPARPNPFNPSTSLEFELARPGRAVLRIHDARGRLVRTLVDEPLPAGRHARTWDGTADGGRPLPSGAYFCRLAAGAQVATGKLLLLK